MVEKEDYINIYIIILIIIINSLYQSGWKGGSPAAGNTFVARRELGPDNQHRFLHRSLDVFVLLYSLYLHFWILCICISVTSFWIPNVGISLLQAIPDQKTIVAHYIVIAEYTLTFAFLRMYFYSFSSIFYFSCSLQCNIITRHQLTTNPQIRVCQYETWFWSSKSKSKTKNQKHRSEFARVWLKLITYFANKVCVVVPKKGCVLKCYFVNRQFM